MALTPQARAAEEARRYLGRLAAAASSMDMAGLVRVDVDAHTGGFSGASRRSVTTQTACTFVTDQAKAAEDDGLVISFGIHSWIPVVFATQTGLVYG